jgi:hypothetical protein
MQTTLRINDRIYREAKAQAARTGVTVTRFIEEALSQHLRTSNHGARGYRKTNQLTAEIEERNRLMEALLRRTSHFRLGSKPTREEMNER